MALITNILSLMFLCFLAPALPSVMFFFYIYIFFFKSILGYLSLYINLFKMLLRIVTLKIPRYFAKSFWEHFSLYRLVILQDFRISGTICCFFIWFIMFNVANLRSHPAFVGLNNSFASPEGSRDF